MASRVLIWTEGTTLSIRVFIKVLSISVFEKYTVEFREYCKS